MECGSGEGIGDDLSSTALILRKGLNWTLSAPCAGLGTLAELPWVSSKLLLLGVVSSSVYLPIDESIHG
jgi:hypothetical protein